MRLRYYMFFKFSTLTILLFIFLLPAQLPAQGWEWQNPLPQGNRLKNIQFTDSQNGWVLSDDGTNLLRTTDAGQTWQEELTSKVWTNKIFFIDQLNGWGVGSGEPPFIIRTTDGGKTWKDLPIPEALNDRNENLWDVYFINLYKGYITGPYGIAFYTDDGGITWNRINFNQPYFLRDLRSIYFIDSLKGFVIGDTPLLITKDGGKSWIRDSSISEGRANKIFFMDSLYGWILGYDQVYRTTDGGGIWIGYKIDTGIGYDQSSTDITFIDYQKGWISTGKGLYATVDSGKTWVNINTNYTFEGIYFTDEKRGWATGRNVYPEVFNLTNKLFYTSDGGLNWTTDYSSVTDQPLHGIDFLNENDGWAVGRGGEIIHTSDGGNIWNKQTSNTPEWLRDIDMWNKDSGCTVGLSGTILRTTNGGSSWEANNLNSEYNLEAGSFTKSGIGWVAGWNSVSNTGIIFYTNNGAVSWEERTPLNARRLLGIFFIDTLTGWAASGGGTTIDWGEVYKTNDGGKSWILQFSDYSNHFRSIFFVDSLNGWLASEKGLLKTTDGGNNWELKEVFKDFGAIWSFTFYKEKGWAAGLQGRFAFTKDGGETWIPEARRTAFTFYDMDFINENVGWCVGDFGTVLKTTTGGITTVNNSNYYKNFSSIFELNNNYPNPFNPTTVISYSVPSDGFISLKVYDILGNEVAELINDLRSSGSYKVKFNATNLASGVYIYRIQFLSANGGFTVSKKMILAK